jgi:nucleotide-binding universal stress UspA family protein
MAAFRSVAVAVDGSAPSERAFASAVELAKLTSAPLAIVGVVPAPRVYSDQGGAILEVLAEDRREFAALVKRSADSARATGIRTVTTDVREGAIVDEILAFLDQVHPDVVVLGARGLSTTSRLLLGSVSDGVLHHANCSVLVVRPEAKPRPAKSGSAPRSKVSARPRDSTRT